MTRGILIAGNWKMNQGIADTRGFFQDLEMLSEQDTSFGEVIRLERVRACIFPPALSIDQAQLASAKLSFPVHIGAQNAHWEKKGAFTGEVSGAMLKEAGLSWVLIGHSERRQYFGETDETVRKRTESLLAQGLQVILCIGETREQRERGETAPVLRSQLQGAIPSAASGAASYLDGRLVLAYEPVWAIGTGLTASPQQAQEAHLLIRQELSSRFGAAAAEKTQLLYGGSVTPENVGELLGCQDVDGALVGGASLKAESYLALLRAAVNLATPK